MSNNKFATANLLPIRGALTVIALLLPCLTYAYVGPGAGITMLGSLWGLIVAVVFVLIGVLILPIKLLRNKAKKRKEEQLANENQNSEQAESEPDTRQAD